MRNKSHIFIIIVCNFFAFSVHGMKNTEDVTDEELKNMKSTYITSFFYRQETNNAQASSLASNEVLHGNWRRALTMNDDLKKVTVADVNKAFNKYIRNLTWVYQGNPSKADPALYTSDTKLKLPPSKVTKPIIN